MSVSKKASKKRGLPTDTGTKKGRKNLIQGATPEIRQQKSLWTDRFGDNPPPRSPGRPKLSAYEKEARNAAREDLAVVYVALGQCRSTSDAHKLIVSGEFTLPQIAILRTLMNNAKYGSLSGVEWLHNRIIGSDKFRFDPDNPAGGLMINLVKPEKKDRKEDA